MTQKRILKTVLRDSSMFPDKSSNCLPTQQETFLFMYKKEHTKYISSNKTSLPSGIIWEFPGKVVKIRLKKQNHQGTKKNDIDEKTFWGWLQKNLEEDYVKPYYPQSNMAEEEKKNHHESPENNKNHSHQKLKVNSTELGIALLERGFSNKKIMEKLILNEQGGFPQPTTRERNINLIQRQVATKCNPTQFGFLEQVLNPIKTIEIKFIKTVEKNRLAEAIHLLDFAKENGKKVIPERNSENIMQLRKKAVMRMISKWRCKKTPIFIAFPKSSSKETLEEGEFSNNVKITVVLAMTDATFLGYQCFKGDATESEVHAFLAELLKNNQKIYNCIEDYVFVINEGFVHGHQDDEKLREFLQIIYLPPHSAYLNPAEEVRSEWKKSFKEKPYKTVGELMNAIHSSLKQLDASRIRKAYSNSLNFYPRCLQCVPIE